ncbi:MAG: histidine phosphatase family protein [Aeromicrobium sp.]|uniref:histidine phosphatase family protein n=1 Tax=Aeromicrobium sp. TaxID=1871063 RepID=UPI0039E2EDCA
MSARTTVHLIRHGEVDNPGKVLYGRLPEFYLSDLGHEMARRVADHLGGNDITHLVASPLERAQQTAQPLADALGATISTDPRVIEAGNLFEGKVVGVGPKAFLHPGNWWLLRNPWRPSWGEPYTEVARRMREAVADAREAARGHEAAVVSHQLPVWIARLAFEGRKFAHDPRNRECTLASITSLHFDGDDYAGFSYAEPAADLLPDSGDFVGGA